MSNDAPPLVAEAIGAQTIDLGAAAEEAGLESATDADLPLLWLTIVVKRAGLGLPSDPLRARGWLRFGRMLAHDEKPMPGDIALASVEGEEVAGVVGDTARSSVLLFVGPGETRKLGSRGILSVRRPVMLPAEG